MIKQPDTQLKRRVLLFLESNCIGREQAITGDRITDILNIHDRRVLREVIHQLREEGKPILSLSSKPAGYFIPKDLSEADESIDELVGLVIELRKICKGIKQGLDERFPGNQIKLDLGA